MSFKNETADEKIDFKGQNFFTVWSLPDWRARMSIFSQILLGEELSSSDITKKLIQDAGQSPESVVFALMFKAIVSVFSFPSWSKEECVKMMLNHSLFSMQYKSPQQYKSYVSSLFNYLKLTVDVNPIQNRAATSSLKYNNNVLSVFFFFFF